MTILSSIQASGKLTFLLNKFFTFPTTLRLWHPCLFPQENKVFGTTKLRKSAIKNQGIPDFAKTERVIFWKIYLILLNRREKNVFSKLLAQNLFKQILTNEI